MIELIQGGAFTVLRGMPDRSVNCCVTSPPYYGLRDYQCEGQIGLEDTPEAYVARLVEVFREVRRVMADDGTLWLNLGDSYAAGKCGRTDGGRPEREGGFRNGRWTDGEWTKTTYDMGPVRQRSASAGLAPKQLLGIPWRVAFALQADGWYLRSDIIWAKPNPMPESVRDRPTRSHEYLFLLSKRANYYYDGYAVREPVVSATVERNRYDNRRDRHKYYGGGIKHSHSGMKSHFGHLRGSDDYRNRRTVWTIAPAPYRGAHFSTFPPALVEPCILAGTSAHGHCSACGAGWVRETVRPPKPGVAEFEGKNAGQDRQSSARRMLLNVKAARALTGSHDNPFPSAETVGWRPSCSCNADVQPGIVLDPFVGSGTTLMVAAQHGRGAIGIDLSSAYLDLARERVRKAMERHQHRLPGVAA